MIGNALDIVTYLMGQDKTVLWDLNLHKKKKSSSQNKMYWELVGEIARLLHVSTNYVHNKLLRECAPICTVAGQPVRIPLPDTEDAENQTMESMYYHVKPTSQVIVGKDGITYRTYVLLKGSSEMNTKEMSMLIDRCIEYAKQMGIETDELAYIKNIADKQ